MARDYYETTIALPDSGNVLRTLENVKVSVVPRGVQAAPNTLVDIFVSDTGVTRGPDPKAGATGSNPFFTGHSGSVRFWAEAPGEYDIVFEDQASPARINDRVSWNASAVGTGSLPTKVLVGDGGITLAMLAAEIKRQLAPIGEVIEWYRPSTAVQPPEGWEICDGHIVSQHQFVGFVGSFATPDLRQKFILGADASKAAGTGIGGDINAWDNVANAPAIGAGGGSNKHILTAAQLPVTAYQITNNRQLGGGASAAIRASGGEALVGWLSGPATYGVKNEALSVLTENTALNVSNPGGGNPHQIMPQWVGLLRLMKVRWA